MTPSGLRGEAAIVGIAEWTPQRRSTREPKFTIEQWALLSNWHARRIEWLRVFLGRFAIVPYSRDLGLKWASYGCCSQSWATRLRK